MKHIIALSGGKDSVALALKLHEVYPETKFQCIITPTGDELPEMKTHWEYLKTILPYVKKITTSSLVKEIEKKRMIPNFRARWCTAELKINPMLDFLTNLDSNSMLYVGLRADEPGRFGLSTLDKQIVVSYPLRDWGWGIDKVWSYLDEKNIKIPFRTDCGCCFYQRLGEWRELLIKYPERYQKYVEIEAKFKHTFRSPQRDTWPASLDNLRREFISGRKLRKSNGLSKDKKCRFCSM